jgi:hypothetical protein
MWKYIAVFAVVFGVTVYVARQDERAAQQAAHLSNNASPAKPDTEHPQKNISDAERHTPTWYTFFRWPSGTTTWAIILTLLAIAEQTSQTAKAAKATRDSVGYMEQQAGIMDGQLEAMKSSGEQTKALVESADLQAKQLLNMAKAARLSAESVINSERPWMFINIVMDIGLVGSDPPVNFRVKFVNTGRTPAEVISFEQHLEPRKSTDDLPVPPKYSTPDEHVLRHTRLVAQGAEWHDSESYFSLQSNFNGDNWKEIKNSTVRAVYWGRLRYRDLIEQPTTIHEIKGREISGVHETCFCYFYSPALRDFMITGPEGYNKHT